MQYNIFSAQKNVGIILKDGFYVLLHTFRLVLS